MSDADRIEELERHFDTATRSISNLLTANEALERENARLLEALGKHGIRSTGYGWFCLICQNHLEGPERRAGHAPDCLLAPQISGEQPEYCEVCGGSGIYHNGLLNEDRPCPNGCCPPQGGEQRTTLEKARERLDVAVWEFLSDWKKGDFSLSTLAALDAQSMAEAFDAYRLSLAPR